MGSSRTIPSSGPQADADPTLSTPLEGRPGEHISKTAARASDLAASLGHTVIVTFNGLRLPVKPGDSAEQVEAAFDAAWKEQDRVYRASPEAIARAAQSAAEVVRLQSQADKLTASVDDLDLTNRSAVLDFLCALQPCSDRIGVTVDGKRIAARFAEAGLVPNMNVGDEAVHTDADANFLWLVGQALDGLTRGPAIHGVLLKFADDWRQKYA